MMKTWEIPPTHDNNSSKGSAEVLSYDIGQHLCPTYLVTGSSPQYVIIPKGYCLFRSDLKEQIIKRCHYIVLERMNDVVK